MGGRGKGLAARQPDSDIRVSAHYPLSRLQWPAVIQYQGDDELLYLAGEEDWQSQLGQQPMPFAEQDRLIDSRGRVFYLRTDASGAPALQVSAERIELSAFTTLLRAHAVRTGSCCAGKVGCSDLAEGMCLIGRMEDA